MSILAPAVSPSQRASYRQAHASKASESAAASATRAQGEVERQRAADVALIVLGGRCSHPQVPAIQLLFEFLARAVRCEPHTNVSSRSGERESSAHGRPCALWVQPLRFSDLSHSET